MRTVLSPSEARKSSRWHFSGIGVIILVDGMMNPKETTWQDRIGLVTSSIADNNLIQAEGIAERIICEFFEDAEVPSVTEMEEALGFLDEVIRQLVSRRAWKEVGHLLSTVLERLPDAVRDGDRAYLQYHAGVAAFMRRDFAQARTLLEGARAGAELAGDPELASLALRILGHVDFEDGRPDEASELTQLAWTLNPVASALCHLGLINLAAGDFHAAREAYEQCLSRFGGLPSVCQEELASRLRALGAAGESETELAFFHELAGGGGLDAGNSASGATPSGQG